MIKVLIQVLIRKNYDKASGTVTQNLTIKIFVETHFKNIKLEKLKSISNGLIPMDQQFN